MVFSINTGWSCDQMQWELFNLLFTAIFVDQAVLTNIRSNVPNLQYMYVIGVTYPK